VWDRKKWSPPPFCSGLGPPPFPISLLLSPSFANLIPDSLRIQHMSCVLQVTISCWILKGIGVRPLMLFQPGSDGLKSLSHIGFGAALPSTGNTIYKVGTLLKRLFVFNLDQLLSYSILGFVKCCYTIFFENVLNILREALYVRDGYPGLVFLLDVVNAAPPFILIFLVSTEQPVNLYFQSDSLIWFFSFIKVWGSLNTCFTLWFSVWKTPSLCIKGWWESNCR